MTRALYTDPELLVAQSNRNLLLLLNYRKAHLAHAVSLNARQKGEHVEGPLLYNEIYNKRGVSIREKEGIGANLISSIMMIHALDLFHSFGKSL
jgi:hypothetical protein